MFPIRDNIKSRSFPIVNYVLILLNIAFFLKELDAAAVGLFDQFIFSYGLIPAAFFQNPIGHSPTILTSMFLHGSWGHVLGNMWFLYIFGDNVEDNLGHLRYLIYYVLMGVGAAMTQAFMHPTSQVPMIGASGAIAGILGSYVVLYPRARILTLFIFIILIRFIELPAFFYLGYWFMLQAINGMGSLSSSPLRGEMGGVAWWAHAGGFATGFILIPFFKRRKRSLI